MPTPAGPGPAPLVLTGPLTYDPVLSRVRINVDSLPSSADVVHIERSTDQVVWTTVRGGTAVPVVAGVAKLDDYEFAADVLNYYRIRAADVLNANPYFETDAADWFPGGGTFVRSTAQFHEGAASGLLTPDGVTAEAQAGSGNVAASAFTTYRARAWVRCAVSRNVTIGFNWYSPGPTFFADALTSVAVTANTWTALDFDATSPATTAFAQLKFVMSGTPAAGHLLYVDEAFLTGPIEETLFVGSITPVLDGVVLKSLARPFLNLPVTVRNPARMRRPSRTGVFEVIGRSLPVAVTDVRGSKRFTLALNTYSPEEAKDLDLLLASGDILLLHVPATGRQSGTPGGYIAVLDSEEEIPDTVDLAEHVFAVDCVHVAAPGPDIIGATITCAGILNLYASCAALLAAHPTCADVLSLVGSPGDVLVP